MANVLNTRNYNTSRADDKGTIGRRIKTAMTSFNKKRVERRSTISGVNKKCNAKENEAPPTRKRTILEDIGNKRNVIHRNKKAKIAEPTPREPDVSRTSKPTKITKPKETVERVKSKIPVPVEQKRLSLSAENNLDLTELNDAIELILCRPPEGVRDIDKEDHDSLSNTIYAPEIIDHLKDKERSHNIDEHFLDGHGNISANMRAILYDWLVQVQAHLNLEQGTLHLTTAMVDRFLQRRKITLAKLQLVGITCLFLATKLCERYTPAIETLIHLTDNTYGYQEVIAMEKIVLRVLEFELCLPEPVYYLPRFINALTDTPHKQLENLARYLLDLSLPDITYVQHTASVRAAAAVLLAHKLLDRSVLESDPGNAAWNLAFYSGHVEAVLRPCMKRYARSLQKVDASKYQGAKMKYSDEKAFGAVSRIDVLNKSAYLMELVRGE